ncbi:bifunctional DNA primase/polymerase [Kitasatospora herbaricolor]|uniref:Bifunctional DNA primase/polymerase n=1 Tax=Kitasatospora herbaricolor TaxID=68217 RepID=A0ABZ1W7B2_9ACTN|nr:bifunctional DNA primase/polymerase [Kitasatospora herbaricolor]
MDSKGSAGGPSGGPGEPPSAGPSAGLDWLAEAAPDPEACRREWHRGGAGLLLLPAGRRWDVLLVAGSLGRPALAALARHPGRPGPVYADFGGEHLGFLVPVGTAARWLGTGVRTAGNGSWIVVPHPAGRGSGVRWLVPPDGSGRLTDPALLEFALHEAAADLVHPCR